MNNHTLTDLRLFRSWFNDFLTIERFAEYYGLTTDEALAAIERGKNEHNEIADGEL